MATRPISNVINVWNQNTTYTGIGLNITDTQSGTNSKLLNLQINSGSKFYVDKNGNVVATGNISSSKFTASYAHIGGVPSTSQYKFGDNSLPDLYSNKIRGYSGSFTYLEIISGSAPRAKMPFIDTVTDISGKFDNIGNVSQNIRFRNNGGQPVIYIEADDTIGGGAVNIGSPEINVGAVNVSGPNSGRSPIEVDNGAISFNPTDPNDCIDFNGCLNLSGNLFVKGVKVGPNSLFLSSSATESRIHGTNLTISSSVISASRMHVGGKTKTTQYKFYDGSKPDLYVNKLRAYSGSFTSLEIISGSEGSMSIKNAKGQTIFESKADATGGLTKIGDDLANFFSNDDQRALVFPGVVGKARTQIEFNACDIIANTSCSISGNLHVLGGTKWLKGAGDANGTLDIFTTDENNVVNALSITDANIKFKGVTAKMDEVVMEMTGNLTTISGGTTNYLGTHSINIGSGKVTIDGTNAPIDLTQRLSGELFLNLGKTLIKVGTQSLWITGSTISGSELNIYAPDFASKINTYHITGSSGKYNKLTATNIFGMVTGSISGSKGTFNSFNFNAITASSRITSSTVGASSGKYAKIQIGNQTYKILLYADS